MLFGSTRFFMDWKLQTDMTHTCYMVLLFYDPSENKNRWELITRINNASMHYPFVLEAGVCYCFFPSHNSKIFKKCNIGIFWFSDPNFDGFFVQKNSRLGDVNQIFFRWSSKRLVSSGKWYDTYLHHYSC